LYSRFYGTEYKYATQTKSSSADVYGDPESLPFDDEDPYTAKPFDPLAAPKVTKGFTKTTDFDPDSPMPFGSVLDAPLR
jgi:hypothetical protein